jgi:hypothetical protein
MEEFYQENLEGLNLLTKNIINLNIPSLKEKEFIR